MSRIVALLLVILFMVLARFAFVEDVVFTDALTTLTFGFLLLAAYLVGDVLAWFRIPKITGYILAGILFGPHAAAFVTAEAVADLKLIDDLALTFIALAAGGELRVGDLRRRARSIAWTVALQMVVVFAGFVAFVYAMPSLLPFLADGSPAQIVAVAAILGTFALARSPSSAIAIISECKARGPFTDTALGVTVVMDLLVIVVFAVVVSVSQTALVPGGAADLRLVAVVCAELAGSLAAGLLLGFVISFYIRWVRAELAVFILGMAFMVAFFSRQFAHLLENVYSIQLHLEPMLICVTAGFWVQNFSRAGNEFMERIDRSSLPIYVVFFSLTGAALNIDALRETWLVAIVLTALRFALIWAGAYLGAAASGDPPRFRTFSGLSFITQAGVSLGLAGIVMSRFPEWGGILATTIVAIITLNQVIGPVAFKLALAAVGEARIRRAR